MDVFDSRHYYKVNKLVLSCVGLWVFQTVAKKRLARILIFFSLTSALIPEFNFLFSALVHADIDGALECLLPLLLVILCTSHIGIFIFNEKKLVKLVNCIQRDCKFWSSGYERKILQKNAVYGRLFTLLYAVNVYVSVFTFVSMSLTPIVLDILVPLNESRPKQPVYAVKFPFNEDKYFCWILVHGSLSAFYNLTVLFSCEAMLAISTQHVCGLFAIISYRLKNLAKFMNGESHRQAGKDRTYKEISFCIKWHSHALEYAKILESCFSPLLFVTVVLNVIGVSLLGILTLNAIGSLAKTIKFGAFTSACLVHLFCISLPGQNLVDYSTEVAVEVYNGCWYQMPIKSKKLLILIINRSQIPCKLTAGKFCTMDMMTFSKLLQTSASYFTVLSSLR